MGKLTLSIPDETIDGLKALAKRQGASVSAIAAKAIRDHLVQRAVQNYDRYKDLNPEIRKTVDDARAAHTERITTKYAALAATDNGAGV